MKNAFAVIYGHPELHGPQICAIHMIARYYDRVDMLFRNVAETRWQFPNNVALMEDGKLVDQEHVYKKATMVKIFYFTRFTAQLLFALVRRRYDVIVLFDPLALYAFSLVYRVVRRDTIIWYHNYDAVDLKQVKKYTLNWFAQRAPLTIFPRVDFFTLPMENRLRLFPIHLLKNKPYLIPNFSMIEAHSGTPNTIAGKTVRLLFVGSISPNHGLEEIIALLSQPIEGLEVRLLLKGYIRDEYKAELQRLAQAAGVESRLEFLAKGPWQEVPEVTRAAHIGIAIYTGSDQMTSTLGRGGSGKVYQYIAEGLPVLMNEEFFANFSDCKWAVGTQLTQDAIKEAVGRMIREYATLSQHAADSFRRELNCDRAFAKFLQFELPKSNPTRDYMRRFIIKFLQFVTFRVQIKGMPKAINKLGATLFRDGEAYRAYNGVKVRIKPDVFFHRHNVLNYGGYEMVKIFERFLKPGDVYVDVGANLGYMALNAERIVGPTGAVIALEPDSEILPLLKTNRELNHGRFAILEKAASERTCTETFNIATESGLSRLENNGKNFFGMELLKQRKIETDTLDNIVAATIPGRAINIIKIDVEGHELRVLKGATGTLKADRPILLLEVNHGAMAQNGLTYMDILNFLDQFQYTFFAIDSHGADWLRFDRSPTFQAIATRRESFLERPFDLCCLPPGRALA